MVVVGTSNRRTDHALIAKPPPRIRLTWGEEVRWVRADSVVAILPAKQLTGLETEVWLSGAADPLRVDESAEQVLELVRGGG